MFFNFKNTTGGQYTQYISTTDLYALVIEITETNEDKVFGVTITPTYAIGDDKIIHIGDIDFDVTEEELNKTLNLIRKNLSHFYEIYENLKDMMGSKIDSRITLVDVSKVISVRLYDDDDDRHKIILNNGSELEIDLKSSLKGFMRKLLLEGI